jgi:hypothetical protein
MALINPQAPARNVDRISPKGFAEAFDIYELRSGRDDQDTADFEICREVGVRALSELACADRRFMQY